MQFEKLYYSIGEVAVMLDVSVSTLRYWEQTIEHLNIPKARGRRRYDQAQIVRLKKVRMLVYRMGFSVAGVDKFLTRKGKVYEGELVGDLDIGGEHVRFQGEPVRVIIEKLGR